MKKSLMKLSFGVALVAVTLFVTIATSVEPADAYYGNWKSQTQTCTVTEITTETLTLQGTTSNGHYVQEITIVKYEGTERNCVDGSGWCFWGSSCS